MPLNEYKYLKKTDKGQHIDLATGQPQDDKVFDAMNAVADKTDVEKSLKGDTKEAAHAALMAGGFIPGPAGAISDAVDAFLYLREGKPGQALLAGLSVLPFGSILFRGAGQGQRLVKSFEVAGKRVPRKMAKKYIDEFGELVQKGFHDDLKLVGGVGVEGKYVGAWGKAGKKALHTTTSVSEAGRLYGDKILRLEIDDKILRQMIDDDLLLKVPKPRHGQNVSHLIFKEGISLNKISDLELFRSIEAYTEFLRTKGFSQMQINKVMQNYYSYY